MADIVIRTTVVERGLYGDDYEAFVEALRREGFDPHIEEPAEYRSVDQVAVEIGIWVADHLFEIAAAISIIDVIRRAARETISMRKAGRRTQQARRLPIYGRGGRLHGYVDLPADEQDAPKS